MCQFHGFSWCLKQNCICMNYDCDKSQFLNRNLYIENTCREMHKYTVLYRHTELTPHCHEHRKEHCAIIVEQQAHLWTDKTSSEHQQVCMPFRSLLINALMYLRICAGVGELPHFASLVTEWTHDCVRLTNLLSTTQ